MDDRRNRTGLFWIMLDQFISEEIHVFFASELFSCPTLHWRLVIHIKCFSDLVRFTAGVTQPCELLMENKCATALENHSGRLTLVGDSYVSGKASDVVPFGHLTYLTLNCSLASRKRSVCLYFFRWPTWSIVSIYVNLNFNRTEWKFHYAVELWLTPRPSIDPWPLCPHCMLKTAKYRDK